MITPGESIEFSPAQLFHAGYSDLQQKTVTFSPLREPARTILYGTFINLPPGEYKLMPQIKTNAKNGTLLGHISAVQNNNILSTGRIIAGKQPILKFRQNNYAPIRIELKYSALAEITIGEIKLKREK